MKTREEIKQMTWQGSSDIAYFSAILEVLLDIRDLLKPEITGDSYDK